MVKRIHTLLVLFLYCTLSLIQAQQLVFNSDGSVTVSGNSPAILTFDNAQFRYIDLLGLSNMESGIIGTVLQGGFVELSVYGGLNKNILIFKKTLRTSSATFSGQSNSISWEGISIPSDNTKLLASRISIFEKEPSKCTTITNPELFRATMVSPNGYLVGESVYAECLKNNNFSIEQPVKVEIKALKSTIKRIKYPGQTNELALSELNPQLPFSVDIQINGVIQGTATSTSTPTINAKIGDEIKFIFKNSNTKNGRTPVFYGIPSTWIARFGGETKYFCTPSIQPNERKPWIGFDSQVHGTLLRRYPKNYQERYPDFEKDSEGNIISWSYYLQREMDANKKTYTPEFKWQKQKTVPVKQRNNQKEGLNMELLI